MPWNVSGLVVWKTVCCIEILMVLAVPAESTSQRTCSLIWDLSKVDSE